MSIGANVSEGLIRLYGTDPINSEGGPNAWPQGRRVFSRFPVSSPG
jgi:hypothetical protein